MCIPTRFMDCQVSRLVSIWLGVGGAGPVSDWLRLARAGSVTPGLTGCRRRPRPEGATADRPTGAVQDTGHGSVEARSGRGPAPPAGCPQRWRRDRREGSGCLASSAAVTDATNSGSGAWRSELQVPQGWPLPGLAPWPSPHVAPPPHPVTSPHLCHLLEGPSPQTVTLG